MTTESTALVIAPPESVELGMVRGSNAKDLVARATEVADQLATVITSRKLFSMISNKRYVRCEGWTTLAALMGFVPREASMTRREDGSYEAVAELVRITDGVALTRASAECGMSEPTWKGRADYARRSMAATRATSKVCRLAFSWVMGLAGFEVTPFEEIPEEERHKDMGRGGKVPAVSGPRTAAAPTPASAPSPQPLSEKPAALTTPDPAPWEPGEKLWPVGDKKGTALKDLPSGDLIAALAWIKKTGRYADFEEPIGEVLESRAGE